MNQICRFENVAGPSTSSFASCLRSLPALFLGRHKANRPLGRIGQRHEFAQGVEDLLELVARVEAEGVVVHGQSLGLVVEFVSVPATHLDPP